METGARLAPIKALEPPPEPHAARRRAILNKHGHKVRHLYGHDLSTALQAICVFVIQILVSWSICAKPWWTVVLAAYVIGGTCNKNLLFAIHELSHHLVFREPSYNRMLAVLCNCPLVIPFALKFRSYHQDHHAYLGIDGLDADLPTATEVEHVRHPLMKTFWVIVFFPIYTLRPLIVRPKAIATSDVVNAVVVLSHDMVIFYLLGAKSLVYMLLGTILGHGLHPMAGHGIAEHCIFKEGQETYSYYGCLNRLSYNVGFHNEHHDFPQIPHSRLYKLRMIAPEFYMNLYHHTSWTWVIWSFIMNPQLGPASRTRRMSFHRS